MTEAGKLAVYRIKRIYHLFKTGLAKGLVAQVQYGFPEKKLQIFTITGTDGKTTSSTLLYHVLKKAGYKVALLSTVAAYIEDTEIDTGFHVTSPSPDQMFAFLKQMVDTGITHVVMEVTSHGSYQYRNWGIYAQVAGVTNITHEHLDYHVTYEEYVKAKADILKQSKVAILNRDDGSFHKLKKLVDGAAKLDSYSSQDRLYWKVSQAIKNRFPEEYNQMNARLVYTMAGKIGITPEVFISAIESFPGIAGRMQEVVTKKPFRVVVDFAHTPNALKGALLSLRQQLKKQKKQGKLIAVFGCAGLRDRTKRPLMGAVGAELADIAIFTAEDPRTEEVWSIIRQMKEQLLSGHDRVLSIADRKKALEFALTVLAKPGDIVGVFGKGHEKSMCYGTIEYPWSDIQAVQEILE